MHGRQRVFGSKLRANPGSQTLQTDIPSEESNPRGHTSHSCCFVPETQDCGQFTHSESPLTGACFPAWQLLQSLAPLTPANRPAQQVSQVSAAAFRDRVPTSHKMQAGAPSPEKRPLGHSKHAAVLFCPTNGLCVPLSHAMQSPSPLRSP